MLRDREKLQDTEAALIFGGDGTVHHYLATLMEKKIPLLVVPIGSGNDFAHAIGIDDPDGALAAWDRYLAAGFNAHAIDLGEIQHGKKGRDKTYYCCVAGAGLDSATNRLANSFPSWLRSHGGYALSLVLSTGKYRATGIKVHSHPKKPTSEPAFMVAVANAPSYGAGMKIAPMASVDDHRLDVCFVRKTKKLRLLKLFPRVYRGRHIGLPEVEYFQTDRVHLSSEEPLDVFADGEYVCQTPVEIRVVPDALRVIVNA